MALPIKTHPSEHITYKSLSGNSWYNRVVLMRSTGERYTQAPPWDRPLPFSRQVVLEESAERFGPNPPEIPDVTFMTPKESGALQQLAYERAFGKLKEAVHSNGTGDLGITLAQSKLTYKLYKDYLHKFVYMQKLASIAETLNRFAAMTRKTALAKSRKGREAYRRKAARVLGCRPPTDREVRRRLDGQLMRTASSSFAAEYLAFHYGWSPLFAEIYQQLKFLSEGIAYPKGYYQVSGSSYFNTTESNDSFDVKIKGRYVCKLGAVAEVENELLFCLGVVGLANPAAILWDAVKWSFVVDWVASIGPRLQNQTAFLGIRFSQAYRTEYYSFSAERRMRGKRGYQQSLSGYNVVRKTGVGFPPPPIRVKNPIGRDWGKAFSQISLLVMFGLGPTRK